MTSDSQDSYEWCLIHSCRASQACLAGSAGHNDRTSLKRKMLQLLTRPLCLSPPSIEQQPDWLICVSLMPSHVKNMVMLRSGHKLKGPLTYTHLTPGGTNIRSTGWGATYGDLLRSPQSFLTTWLSGCLGDVPEPRSVDPLTLHRSWPELIRHNINSGCPGGRICWQQSRPGCTLPLACTDQAVEHCSGWTCLWLLSLEVGGLFN